MSAPARHPPHRWLLIRGLSRDQRHWGDFPDRLAAVLDAEVLCIDPPGFGTERLRPSPRTITAITEDIRARFRRDASGSGTGLIGISLGGMVALDWCGRHPGDFGHCVAINTSTADLSAPQDRFRPGALPALLGARYRSPVAAERAILGATLNRGDLDLEDLARRQAQWRTELPPHPGGLAAQAAAAVRFRLPPSLHVAVLVLTSRGDRLVSSGCSRRIASRLRAPVRVHPRAGHDLVLDDPAWVCDQIRRWLDPAAPAPEPLGADRFTAAPERRHGGDARIGELPCSTVGAGPPLLVLAGLSGTHANPVGMERRLQMRAVRPLADDFSVHLASRRPGLAAGTTIADLAADVAAAIESRWGGPVPVVGISTGGSIAQQLAIAHPHLVERLVLASTGCRLGPRGRRAQLRLAELTEAGRPRAAWAALGPCLAATAPGGWAMSAAMWLAGVSLDPDDPSDMVATIRAEDAFDAADDLHRICAPTLVVSGGRDGFYSPELIAETARRIPDARLCLYPKLGHASVLTHRPAQHAVVRFLARGRTIP